jgi:acetyltransferase-like isoleucine patch superfamily enzyme
MKTARKKLKALVYDIIFWVLRTLYGPNFSDRQYPIDRTLRCVYYQKIRGINRHVPWMVDPTTVVHAVGNIEPGTRAPGISVGCYLDGRNGIVFGKNTWVGPYVRVISMNHDVQDYFQYVKEEPIRIGVNCWIGANAVILPGVQLGNHVVVGAGAVVTKSFLEDDILIAGVPAKMVKKIPPYTGRMA